MKTVLALRHVAYEDLGLFAPVLRDSGFNIIYFDVGVDSFSTVSPLDAYLVVVLGGPLSAYHDDAYPYLRAEIAWLRARLLDDMPTLGIGLGAQLIAAALHAHVYPAPQGKEIGWSALHASATSKQDRHPVQAEPIRHLLDDNIHVLHWHGDTFDLPAGARHLAATAHCPNQAFGWGAHCLALQFHPEPEPCRFEQWLIGRAAEIADMPEAGLVALRRGCRTHGPALKAASEKFLHAWLMQLPEPDQTAGLYLHALNVLNTD